MLKALESGAMYFSELTKLAAEAPKILSIDVDNIEGTITVEADDARKIEWISGVDESNKQSLVVKTAYSYPTKFTNTLNVKNVKGDYVRFRLIGKGGKTYSQPFSLRR